MAILVTVQHQVVLPIIYAQYQFQLIVNLRTEISIHYDS